jgi:5-methylcytosine-specific restriction endonuclease McrA
MPIRPENKARYASDWKAISLRIRAERAQWKCEFCAAEHGKSHPETGSTVVLTVAHLDRTPEDNSDDNLAALCQRCHNRYDAPMRAAGVKARKTPNQLNLL